MDNKGFQSDDQEQRKKIKKMFSWTDGLPRFTLRQVPQLQLRNVLGKVQTVLTTTLWSLLLDLK